MSLSDLFIIKSYIVYTIIQTVLSQNGELSHQNHTHPEAPIKLKIIYKDTLSAQYDFPFAQIPYFVSVFYSPDADPFSIYKYLCSASLVSFKWALTAASCKKPVNITSETYAITAGFLPGPTITVDDTGTAFERGQRHLVTQWIIHPNFTFFGNLNKNDIALLRTEKPFKLNSFVNLIMLLPYSDSSVCDIASLYTSCSVPMFKNKTLATDTENLLLLTVFLIDVHNCKIFTDGKNATGGSSHVCSINDLDRRYCAGNLGSPLICKNKQVGILLDVFGCNETNWSLYTRVDLHQEWIERYVRNGLWYETHKKSKRRYKGFFLCEKQRSKMQKRWDDDDDDDDDGSGTIICSNTLILIVILWIPFNNSSLYK